MSIPVMFVLEERGGEILVEASMAVLPRENDVLEHRGKEYQLGPARWVLDKSPGGAVLSHVEIVVEPHSG